MGLGAALIGTPAATVAAGAGFVAGAVGGFAGYAASTAVSALLGNNAASDAGDLYAMSSMAFDH